MQNKSKLKVLFLTHYSTLYGANKSMLNLISGLKESTDINVILPFKGDLETELKKLEISYLIIPFWPILNSANHKTTFQHFIKGMVKRVLNFWARLNIDFIIKHKKIDIIHSNSSIVEIGYKCSRDTNTKHVWHIREFQKIDCGMDLKRNYETQRKDFFSSDIVITISHSVSNHFNLNNKAYTIYNGVVTLNQVKYTLKKSNYFLFCGTIHPNKGVEDAIIAFANVAHKYNFITLKIVGTADTKYIEYLKKITKKFEVEKKVIFEGYRNDILNIMYNARGLLMCSKNEAMGRVTVEALSQGCPVIGYNNAGTSELITHNFNGLLYRELIDLEKSMIKLIKDTDFTKYLIENGINEVKTKYLQEQYCEKVHSLYTLLQH